MPTVASLTARIGADIGGLEAGLRTAERQVNNFAGRLTSLGTRLSVAVTAPLAGLAVAAVRSATQMDSLKRGLTAVAGSAAEADRQLARLREIAKLPGLGRVEAIAASTQLQAAGLSAKLAEESLLAFGNALATVGKGKAELQGVTLALTQIAAKGKITAEEINQIAERVPQIRVAMQAAFGTANTELLQKMGLTAKQFIEGINAELLKLPRVTGGAQNAFENLADVVGEALSEIGNNILPTLLPIVERLTNSLVSLTRQFAALSPEVRRTILAVAGLAALAGPTLLFLGQFTAALRSLGITIPVLLAALRVVVAFLGGPWGIAIAAAATVVVSNWDTISRSISTWSDEVVPLLRGTWASIQADAQPAMETLKGTVIGSFETLRDSVKSISAEIEERTGGLFKRLQGWLQRNIPRPGGGIAGYFKGHMDRAKEEIKDFRQLHDAVFGDFPQDQLATAARGGGVDFKAEPAKKKLTEAMRQELSLARELRGETARLAMIKAGEDQITQDLADRYSLLSRGRRDDLAGILRQVAAANKQREALEQFRQVLQRVYAETRAARGDPMALLRHAHPTLNEQQLQVLHNANQALARARQNTEALTEAERKRKEVLRSLKQELVGRQLERYALAPEASIQRAGTGDILSELARSGLRLADVLGIVSFTAKELKQDYFALSDEGRKLAESNYWNAQTLDVLNNSARRFQEAAERRIQLHRDTEERLKREQDATVALSEAVKKMRDEMVKTVTDARIQQFNEAIKAWSDSMKENANEVDQALRTIAESLKYVFERSFINIKEGFGGMVRSIIDGIKQMLVQIAAEYLAAQATNAILGVIGSAIGLSFPKVGSVLGSASKRQHGGPVSSGQGYLVGERGPELFLPNRSGRIMANAQTAGGPSIVVNMVVNTPDAQSFQRNRSAILGDLQAQLQRAQRRNG